MQIITTKKTRSKNVTQQTKRKQKKSVIAIRENSGILWNFDFVVHRKYK